MQHTVVLRTAQIGTSMGWRSYRSQIQFGPRKGGYKDDAPTRVTGLSSKRGALFDILSNSVQGTAHGATVDESRLTEDALSRTHSLRRLLEVLDRNNPLDSDSLEFGIECEIARELAAIYRAVGEATSGLLWCSALVRNVAKNLMALFGLACGNREIITNIHSIRLGAAETRLLVSATSEIICRTLLRATDQKGCVLILNLYEKRHGYVCLEICDHEREFCSSAISDYRVLSSSISRRVIIN
jgi:hypothetical protein